MQQTINSVKGPIHAKLHLPGSPQISLRAILLAALAEGVSELSNLSLNSETQIMLTALRQLGIVTQLDESTRSCIIAGGNGLFPKKQNTIWCGQSIICTRLLLAACAMSPGVYYFDSSTEIRDEPISELLDIVKRQGAQIIPSDANKMPFTMIGADNFEGGEILFHEHTPSQIIIALLMLSPFARSPFSFRGDLHRFASVDLTAAMMAEFGVLVHHIHQSQIMVPVPQRYHAHDYIVEPDFGLGAYFFAAAAVTGGEISIQAVKRAQTKQTQVKFLAVLEKMGCHVSETHQGLSVRGPKELQGIEVSMREFSDSFLALAAIAPFAKSPTRISHLGHLRKKEIYRMQMIKMELIKMGIHVEAGDDWIKIFPGTPQGGIVNTAEDKRLAMAYSLMGLKTPGIILEDEAVMRRSLSDFFQLWNKLLENTNIKV